MAGASNSEETVLAKQVKEEESDACFLLALKEEGQDEQPLKRRRVFEGVFPPPRAKAVLENKEMKEVDKKMKLLKNPKVKKNERALLPETVRDRLKHIGLDIQSQYFILDQVSREWRISRVFISAEYGGNMQETCPRPALAFAVEYPKMANCMYFTSMFQPEAPQVPGAPGLWFSTSPRDENNDVFAHPKTVFVQMVYNGDQGTGLYCMMGSYDVKAAIPPYLTPEEYAAQTPQFRRKWADGIKNSDWGLNVLSRILLRKELDHTPSSAEVITAKMERKADCKRISLEDIEEAYSQGKEKMGIWTMKCVGYDNALQEEFIQKFSSNWVPPTKEERVKKRKCLEAKAKEKGYPIGKSKPIKPCKEEVKNEQGITL